MVISEIKLLCVKGFNQIILLQIAEFCTHLKANMAICEQWPFNLNDGRLLVSTN